VKYRPLVSAKLRLRVPSVNDPRDTVSRRLPVTFLSIHSTRSTQPCIPPGSLNRVPASAGGKGGNVTSAGWQVTLCDPMWHVSSRSGVAALRTAIHLLLTYLLTFVESGFIVDLVRTPDSVCGSIPELLAHSRGCWRACVRRGSPIDRTPRVQCAAAAAAAMSTDIAG